MAANLDASAAWQQFETESEHDDAAMGDMPNVFLADVLQDIPSTETVESSCPKRKQNAQIPETPNTTEPL